MTRRVTQLIIVYPLCSYSEQHSLLIHENLEHFTVNSCNPDFHVYICRFPFVWFLTSCLYLFPMGKLHYINSLLIITDLLIIRYLI